MALTRDFKETIKARVQRVPAYRRELLREGVETMLNGDVETGGRCGAHKDVAKIPA
jgi:hypothetical protein